MHGTNDIVCNCEIEDICASIERNLEYIHKQSPNADIIFLLCAHVNGRLDRDNQKIDRLNAALKKLFPPYVTALDLNFLDNSYGELSTEYTSDGLHFNQKAYSCILQHLKKYFKVPVNE